MSDITILIPLKNGERFIHEVLTGIFDQDCHHSFEVILIDSGSTDQTIAIARQFPARLIEIPPESFNHGETRNLGLKLSDPETEFIVFLSQDATPYGRDWLSHLIAPFAEDERVAGVFSRHIPRSRASIATVRQLVEGTQTGGELRLVKQMPDSLAEYRDNLTYYIWFSNTSSAVRRRVFEKHPFKKVDFAEDAVWADEILRAGYKIVYEPSSIVIHSHNYSLIEQFRQNVDHQHAMYELFRLKNLRNLRSWVKQYLGIPLQTWRDYKFAIDSPYFKRLGFGRRMLMVFYSPFWYLATISGGLVGSYLDRLPTGKILSLSRQERLKR